MQIQLQIHVIGPKLHARKRAVYRSDCLLLSDSRRMLTRNRRSRDENSAVSQTYQSSNKIITKTVTPRGKVRRPLSSLENLLDLPESLLRNVTPTNCPTGKTDRLTLKRNKKPHEHGGCIKKLKANLGKEHQCNRNWWLDCTIEPLDITFHIWEYLQPREIMNNVATVCKSWSRMLKGSPVLIQTRKAYERWMLYRNLHHRATQSVGLDYMHTQPEVTRDMRGVLADWLYQVNAEFENHCDTLFLTLALVDRFLSKKKVARTEVQLVGIACLLLASKAEENRYPDLRELLYLCDGIYTRPQLLQMESSVLQTLCHSLHSPETLSFVRHLLHEFSLPKFAQSLSCYLAESTLLHYHFVPLHPSVIATAIVCLTCLQQGLPYAEILAYAALDVNAVSKVARLVVKMAQGSSAHDLQHIFQKYALKENDCVSLTHLPDSFVEMLQQGKTTVKVVG